ncbi:hypothetical protein HDU67_001103 [Dinochytrium kinnereticum]|nr:hypothetical protein HDU67_001103 [Dinochytrium kinnereticum]
MNIFTPKDSTTDGPSREEEVARIIEAQRTMALRLAEIEEEASAKQAAATATAHLQGKLTRLREKKIRQLENLDRATKEYEDLVDNNHDQPPEDVERQRQVVLNRKQLVEATTYLISSLTEELATTQPKATEAQDQPTITKANKPASDTDAIPRGLPRFDPEPPKQADGTTREQTHRDPLAFISAFCSFMEQTRVAEARRCRLLAYAVSTRNIRFGTPDGIPTSMEVGIHSFLMTEFGVDYLTMLGLKLEEHWKGPTTETLNHWYARYQRICLILKIDLAHPHHVNMMAKRLGLIRTRFEDALVLRRSSMGTTLTQAEMEQILFSISQHPTTTTS